jgi:hypothetical protein
MNKFLIELIKFYINKIPTKNTKGRKKKKKIYFYFLKIIKIYLSDRIIKIY